MLEPPTGWDLQEHTFDAQGNRLPELPTNFRRLGTVTAGQVGPLHTLGLRFTEPVTLNHIKSTKDFRIERGGSCVEGAEYAANATCTLLVRFTPQGPGHRLGFLKISHSGNLTPSIVGVTGFGYAPVISFTPAQITTVPGTASSGSGTISGATNMAIDGGDILYIADIGNNLIKEIDSTGIINSITPAFATPASVAVDSVGIIYSTNVPGSTYYFSDFTPWGVQTAFGYTYTATTCTVSAPCLFSSVGMSSPANISIDAYDNVFFLEGTTGAAEMPVANVSQGTGSLELWHLKDQYAYASGGPSSFAVDAGGNLYFSYIYTPNSTCLLMQEPLYDAEYNPTAIRIGGGVKCGFSGDGGQGRGAEISSTLGQIALDIAGDVYFADAGNQRVRRIDALTGIIRTIAGNGTAGYTGDGGKATSATLNNPTGLGVDSQGQVYIISSASSGQVIRKVGPLGMIVFPSQVKAKASAAQSVTVTNTGNNAMILTNTVIGGANAADFKIDSTTTTCILTAGAVLNAGQTCRIGVIFTPAATGARSATLTLLDNTVNGADTVNLSGTGILPSPVFKITAPTNGQTFTSGTPVTFSVSVTSTSGPQPTGTVQFKVDGTNHGAAVTVSATGTASTSVTGLAAGSHTLSVTYSGDANYAAAGPISVTITVTAAVKVQFTSPAAGQIVSGRTSLPIAVTVSSKNSPAPTGTVTFLVDGKKVGAAVNLVLGAASTTVNNLATGTHTIHAAYSGDKYHRPGGASETVSVN
jgi:hypothetical protein